MKKVLCLVLVMVLTVGLLVACGQPVDPAAKGEGAAEKTQEQAPDPSTEPAEEATAEPTEEPTPEPTEEATTEPTPEPTPAAKSEKILVDVKPIYKEDGAVDKNDMTPAAMKEKFLAQILALRYLSEKDQDSITSERIEADKDAIKKLELYQNADDPKEFSFTYAEGATHSEVFMLTNDAGDVNTMLIYNTTTNDYKGQLEAISMLLTMEPDSKNKIEVAIEMVKKAADGTLGDDGVYEDSILMSGEGDAFRSYGVVKMSILSNDAENEYVMKKFMEIPKSLLAN